MSMAYKEFREKSGTDTLKVNITTNRGTDFYFYMPAEAEDLINIGAYKSGSNKNIDYAIEKIDAVNEFLLQETHDKFSFEEIMSMMEGLF